MSGKIQEIAPEKNRNQDFKKPLHRLREVGASRVDGSPFGLGGTVSSGSHGIFPGNSVSEAPEGPVDNPREPLRGKQPHAFNRPVVPANTAKDSVLGEHVQGAVSQRHDDRKTKNRGMTYDSTVCHSNRQAQPEIEI